MQIKDLVVGMEVRVELPEQAPFVGKVVEVRDPIVALDVPGTNTERTEYTNQMVWPRCAENVMLCHADYIKEIV